MTVIVKKFGGSSLESLQRIEQVAEMIIGSYQDHKQIVVVVSAMYGETDRLIQQAGFFQNDPEPREYAALVSTGECVSMSLLCLALIAKGYRAVSLSGAQAGIITDSNYRKAQLLQVQPDRIIKELKQENIVIVAGFQGMDVHGDITTLGRGGSDTTAVAIAAALDASECQIYTDVDGVYSADPKIAPKARKLDSIHIHAMHELASVGAKVLQTRAVELCGQHKIPTRVLSSYKPGSGTLIAHDHIELVQPQVYAITYDRNATKVEIVGIPNAKQMMMMWLTSMMAGGFEVDLLNYSLADQDSSGHLSLVVASDEQMQCMMHLDMLIKKFRAKKMLVSNQIVKLSLIGLGLRTCASGRMMKRVFTILSEANIPVQMVALSETKISLVLDEQYLIKSINILHDELELVTNV